MPFCKKCGIKLENDAVFCPGCGTTVLDTNLSNDQKQTEASTENYKTKIRKRTKTYGVLNLENLPEGHVIDERYEIRQKLGQGGFGAVYRAFDRDMNIDKALKIIPEAIVNDIEAMYDLQKEAQTMISLNHKNIVRVYDFHKTGSIKYIDMEYIDGKTLTEIKLEQKNKQLPEEKTKELAIKIAEGFAYAHANNVIHKDIKPQNVMITSDGEVKLMDFGIAETVRSSMSRIQNTSSSGTLVYMSPEQLLGKDVGKESDIYSFGAMLYELLSGHPPFYKGAIEHQILNEDPEPLDNVSQEMNDTIMKCLEKDYKNRYKDFNAIIEKINPVKTFVIQENKTIQTNGTNNNENYKEENHDKIENKKVSASAFILGIIISIGLIWVGISGLFNLTRSMDHGDPLAIIPVLLGIVILFALINSGSSNSNNNKGK